MCELCNDDIKITPALSTFLCVECYIEIMGQHSFMCGNPFDMETV